MSKIIFLDIDGVLATRRTKYDRARFDEEAVTNLKKILEETRASIVISSTWRFGIGGMDHVKKVFDNHGIKGIIGQTPNLDQKKGLIYISPSRGEEISAWLKENRVDQYIVIDDDSDISPHEEEHIKPDMACGISQKDTERAIRLLGKS